MPNADISRVLMLAVPVAMAALGQPPGPDSPAEHGNAKAAEALARDDRFDAAILKAAAEYEQFKRVSDVPLWAPTLCHVPSALGSRHSVSGREDMHGQKLYFLFARLDEEYISLSRKSCWLAMPKNNDGNRVPPKWENSVGQALVKESFQPVEVPAGEEPKPLKRGWPGDKAEPGAPYLSHDYPPEYAIRDGKFFRTGEPKGLFIMLKLDPKTDGTDEGWVYATTTPDGSKITSSGRVESCMKCHQETTRDRVFGATWSWPHDSEANRRVLPTKENEARLQEQKARREEADSRGQPVGK